MRFAITVLAVLGFMIGSAALTEPAAAASSGYVMALEQQPPAEIDVTIGDERAWYASPVWLVIGVMGVILLVLIIAMAARGGGTTVVKD